MLSVTSSNINKFLLLPYKLPMEFPFAIDTRDATEDLLELLTSEWIINLFVFHAAQHVM